MNNNPHFFPIKVHEVKPQKALKYLKSYVIHYEDKANQRREWELVSRGSLERVEAALFKKAYFTDGSMIFATDPDHQTVVLLKEFRVSANQYLYMLPAGLCEASEDPFETAKREFFEETGLSFEPIHADPSQYISIGIVDERVNVCYGYYSGETSKAHQEANEDAEILILTRDQVAAIIDAPNFCMRSALLLRAFFGLHPFLFKK